MARRSGFESFLKAAARASATAERERQRAVRNQLTQARQLERHARMARNQQIRDMREADKLGKQEYLEDRIAEAADFNSELNGQLEELDGILAHTLAVDDKINFNGLRRTETFAAFKPPADTIPAAAPAKRTVAVPSGLSRFFPGSKRKYQENLAQADQDFNAALVKFESQEHAKSQRLATLKQDYQERKKQYEAEQQSRNAEVDSFEASYMSKDVDAVVAYSEMVLARSEYPAEGFPQRYKVAYNAQSSELVVEYDLPEPSVVPTVAEYKYVKSRDEIESKPRKQTEIKQIYQDVVASMALRTIHELIEADQADAALLVTFTGVVDTTDPATGRPIIVPVISVRAPKADFMSIRLDKVDKAACLKNLGAKVSARPDELQAVKPLVEFNMVDPRFIDQGDALSGLESRPNLMDMTPSEFEVLVANLFGKMGLDSKLTRASRDGGVDAVAFDTRPVLGGKVVIQAKRYKNTVGVEAVRDLYGTMMNEGANKGILVTTSSYGADAYNFSKDKPVELIDGGGLLFLLREHAGVAARIAV
jgi:restriction system protein